MANPVLTRRHRPRGPELVLLLGFVLLSRDPLAESPGHLEQVEVRLVRVPIRVEPARPGACDSLGAKDLVVLEDGVPASGLHLDPKPVDAVHAILVDTSMSMLEGLSGVRRAVTDYVDSVPDDEAVLLATFDGSLVLQAPLSTDRARLKRSLDWIEVGDQTYLWDSTVQVLRFLRTRPERKVLVVITDGCDSQGESQTASRMATDLAVRSDSLVAFTIGVNLPTTCDGSNEDPGRTMQQFSESTGGNFHHLKSASQLPEALSAIRAEMGREQYVVYEPLQFGAGPKDNPKKQDRRWRKIKVRTAKKSDCRVTLAGAPTRYESANRGYFGVTPRDRRDPDGFTPFELADDGDRLRSEIVDVVNDGGVAPDPLGQRLVRTESKREETRRSVEALVPALETVVREDASAEHVLYHALAAAADSATWVAEWSGTPFLINGRTLLEARRALAQGLATHPEYGDWAFDRIRKERLEAIDALIEIRSGDAELETLATVRSYLANEIWVPEPLEYEKHLGAWLGDVRAPELFNAAESWLARRLILTAMNGTPEDLSASTSEADGLWSALGRWLPGAEAVRSIGFLVPGYDPELDAVGFYRVLLASTTSHAIHTMLSGADSKSFLGADLVEETTDAGGTPYSRLQKSNHSTGEPLGVRMVEWMLGQHELSGVLTERLALRAVGYAHPTEKDLFPLLQNAGHTSTLGDARRYLARQVTLIFSERRDPSRNHLVTAYFPFDHESGARYADAPVCIVIPGEAPPTVTGQGLFRGLASAIQRQSIPCVLVSSR